MIALACECFNSSLPIASSNWASLVAISINDPSGSCEKVTECCVRARVRAKNNGESATGYGNRKAMSQGRRAVLCLRCLLSLLLLLLLLLHAVLRVLHNGVHVCLNGDGGWLRGCRRDGQ